jgi:hypothetical protein
VKRCSAVAGAAITAVFDSLRTDYSASCLPEEVKGEEEGLTATEPTSLPLISVLSNFVCMLATIILASLMMLKECFAA